MEKEEQISSSIKEVEQINQLVQDTLEHCSRVALSDPLFKLIIDRGNQILLLLPSINLVGKRLEVVSEALKEARHSVTELREQLSKLKMRKNKNA